jgi:hypothetical protein
MRPQSDPRGPRQRADLLVRVVDGETVVLDRGRGLVHQLNATASLIWDRCTGERGAAEIAADLVGAFHLDMETARRDVRVAVQRFTELGLLEGEGTGSKAATANERRIDHG